MAKAINFSNIELNKRNMAGSRRDKSSDTGIIVAMRAGKVSMKVIGNNSEGAKIIRDVSADMDMNTDVITTIAGIIENLAKKPGNPTVLYVPYDAAFRIKNAFGRLKAGEESPMSDAALEYVAKYRTEEMTTKYVAAVDRIYAALATAKENGRLIIVNELDELSFKPITGVAGIDADKTFILSGQTVEFTDDPTDAKYGIAKIAKGTAVGKDGKLTLAKDTYVRAYMVKGTHTLSVRNLHGDKQNRRLVALVNDTAHPELAKGREEYFNLLSEMAPAPAMENDAVTFENLDDAAEIPA